MRRSEFLQKLALLTGGLFLPIPTVRVRHYDKYYLHQSFVRGFRFYDGPGLLNDMKEGDQLALVREPDNEYDKSAVAIHWNDHKIGFIPAEDNYMLSRLLDIGVPELLAEITHLNPSAATWENVSIAVSVLKERTGPPPENDPAAYLTVLKTPHYYSLKRKDKIITRVYTEDDNDDYSPEDWYEYLVDNSANDSIYSHIHENLSPDVDYGVKDRVFAIKREELPLTELPDEIIKQVEASMEKAGLLFDKEHIFLSFDEATHLVKKISNLGQVADNLGNRFISLSFKNGY